MLLYYFTHLRGITCIDALVNGTDFDLYYVGQESSRYWTLVKLIFDFKYFDVEQIQIRDKGHEIIYVQETTWLKSGTNGIKFPLCCSIKYGFSFRKPFLCVMHSVDHHESLCSVGVLCFYDSSLFHSSGIW